MSEESLAQFQNTLLEVLDCEADPKKIKLLLKEKIQNPYWVDYIDSMEHSMLEVAALLTQKWGKKL